MVTAQSIEERNSYLLRCLRCGCVLSVRTVAAGLPTRIAFSTVSRLNRSLIVNIRGSQREWLMLWIYYEFAISGLGSVEK